MQVGCGFPPPPLVPLQSFHNHLPLHVVQRNRFFHVLLRRLEFLITFTLRTVVGHRTFGRNLSDSDVAQLLDQLAMSDNICFSPSGKPIMAEITPDELRSKLG